MESIGPGRFAAKVGSAKLGNGNCVTYPVGERDAQDSDGDHAVVSMDEPECSPGRRAWAKR